MIGLRYRVGGDWNAYLLIYQDIYFQPLGPALRSTDPAYALLNWISGSFDGGIWPVNLICATIFMAGVVRLARRQPNPWLSMLVGVPYFIIVVAMGYTRQAAAIGIICWALADASPKRMGRLVALILLATLFHKTAILFLPIMLIPILKRNPLAGISASAAFVLIFLVFLRDSSDTMVTNYVSGDYNSQGAAIRIAMNVVAAITMIVLNKRMGFDHYIKEVWITCSILSLISVVALISVSASSGVDRLSLFLIPLQIVTFSRLPYALSNSDKAVPSVLIGLIAYSFSVQFVWLNYGDNAFTWLPYRSFLFF